MSAGGRNPGLRGDAFERAVVEYLNACDIEADRLYGAGRRDDQGDVVLWDHLELYVDCKAHKALELGAWLSALRIKAGLTRVPLVVAKRRQHRPEDAFVITDLRGLVRLLEGP